MVWSGHGFLSVVSIPSGVVARAARGWGIPTL